jgi:chaperone modulatory protein CbpM
MNGNVPINAVPLDEAALSVEELARACNVEPEWVVRHVQAGLLGGEPGVQVTSVRFRGSDLARALKLLRIEREFEANDELAALVIDMGDEIRRLRSRLYVLGVR